MRDQSQRAFAIKRAVDILTRPLVSLVNSLIEFTAVTSYSAGADAVGTASTADGETLQMAEPYGFASCPPANATVLVLAPGGETQARIGIASVAPAGRPATPSGDAVAWTNSGHKVTLANDGAITIESKDGPTITLEVSGNIVLQVAGGKTILLGDNTATLGVARLNDTTSANTTMAVWMAGVQSVCTAAAAFLGIPAPVFPADFGKITQASSTTLSK
jgi:uncharacterized Zn-binding protein involved in type VI secretion